VEGRFQRNFWADPGRVAGGDGNGWQAHMIMLSGWYQFGHVLSDQVSLRRRICVTRK
jgi:hypothetical protein